MTKNQYLEMMEQMGEEPDWEKCPVDWEDFPECVIDAVNIYNQLGARVGAEVGFIGKDYTNFKFLLDLYGIDNPTFTHEVCIMMESRDIEESQRRLKKEYDKLKRK
jgi:hypothetical protein